jgi:hypothetical protein
VATSALRVWPRQRCACGHVSAARVATSALRVATGTVMVYRVWGSHVPLHAACAVWHGRVVVGWPACGGGGGLQRASPLLQLLQGVSCCNAAHWPCCCLAAGALLRALAIGGGRCAARPVEAAVLRQW